MFGYSPPAILASLALLVLALVVVQEALGVGKPF